MIKHVRNPEFEYSYISDGIYLGTNMCCQMHFSEKLLELEKIAADISLEEERIDGAFGVDYFLWLPVKDKKAPKMSQLILGVEVLKKLVAMKIRVYVHCKFGHGRSPTLVSAYLIDKGKTVDEAISFVSSKRQTIHIESGQLRVLEKYYKKINRRKV